MTDDEIVEKLQKELEKELRTTKIRFRFGIFGQHKHPWFQIWKETKDSNGEIVMTELIWKLN